MSDDVAAITINSGEAHALECSLKKELADLHATPDTLRNDDGTLGSLDKTRFVHAARMLRKIRREHDNMYVTVLDTYPDRGDGERLWQHLGMDTETSGAGWSDTAAKATGGVSA